MMSNLRLLAGLTSFISCRYFVHFIATGPDGIFELSITLIIAIGKIPGAVETVCSINEPLRRRPVAPLQAQYRRALHQYAKHNGQRNQTVSDEERKRGDLRQLVEKSERLFAPQPQ